MTTLEILVRVMVSLGFLWLIVRLSGKRGIGSVGPFDLIIAIVLGNLAKDVVLGLTSLPEGVTALGLLAWVHIFIKLLTQRSPLLYGWLWGQPVVLVHHGRVQREALARERLSIRQMESLFRDSGIERLGDVQELRLEPDGRTSAIRRENARPLSPLQLAELNASQEEEQWPYAA